jgi:transposase
MGCGWGMTCWRRLHDWQPQGVWFRLFQVLLDHWEDAGKIDGARAAVDSTFARAFGGVAGSGPNPTDRGRPGVKHPVLVDAQGLPLAGEVTAADVPEIQELRPLVDSCGPLDESGQPQRRPEEASGDRAYDSEPHRKELRKRGIEPKLAKRNTEHGSGLGVFRWVAERTESWWHGFRKLRCMTEKTKPMPDAFFDLALAVICFRFLESPEPQAIPSLC